MKTRKTEWRICISLAGSLALALGLVACSSDDDKSASSDGNKKSMTTKDGEGVEEGKEDDGSKDGDAEEGTPEEEAEGGEEGDEPSMLDEGESGEEGMSFIDGDVEDTNTYCDPWERDCPDGEKCVPFEMGGEWGSRCVPVVGDKTAGDECFPTGDGGDDCDADSLCWFSICYERCEGSPEEPVCPDGTFCSPGNGGQNLICMNTCDPLVQDCDGTKSCLWDGGAETFVCLDIVGGFKNGEPCEFVNVCEPGLICAGAENLNECSGSGCCTPWCDTSDESACQDEGLECVAFFEEDAGPPDAAKYGFCGVPGVD